MATKPDVNTNKISIGESGGYQGTCLKYSRSDDPTNNDHQIPLQRVLSWFQASGTLKSWEELAGVQAKQEPLESFRLIEHPPSNTKNHGDSNDELPLLQGKLISIQTSPQSKISIFPLAPNQSFLLAVEKITRIGTTTCYLVISNCIGYWVADFCGLGGFQQVLFFPFHETNATREEPEESILGGAVLTDGVDLWLPMDAPTVKRAQVESQIYTGNCGQLVLSFGNPGNSQWKRTKTASDLSVPTIEHAHALSQNSTWRGQLEQVLAKRMCELDRRQHDQRVVHSSRRYVLKESQRCLRKILSQEARDGGLPKVQLTELKYRIVPSPTTTQNVSLLVFTLWVEACVVASAAAAKNDIAWIDAHLVCSPPPVHEQKNLDISISKAECHSGVIPRLGNGDVATVLLAVHIEILAVNSQRLEHGGLPMNLGIMGKCGTLENTTGQICGQYLDMFLVFYSSIVQAPFCPLWHPLTFHATVDEGGRGIIYDYRRPHQMKVDISECPDLNVTEFLRDANQSLCANSMVHIDWSHNDGITEAGDASVVCLTIFAMTKAEVVGKWENEKLTL